MESIMRSEHGYALEGIFQFQRLVKTAFPDKRLFAFVNRKIQGAAAFGAAGTGFPAADPRLKYLL